ncbi:glycosyltransferase [Jeotgalibaca porci]|uniref:glycosyltransferase family 2 protein n=1 Tax=Jeotgalibaca porci TaxID=1868793 RepID=UPI003F8DB8B4
MSNKKDKPLVSIITPCYNGEKYVRRLLDSILIQTHKNIEFIFVNDGSNDNTEKIVMSYENKFKERGIRFIYLYQANKGLAGAINTGLKMFTGDYLCWPDSDDYLDKYSIEKRVDFLELNKEYGSVSSDANVYHEDDLTSPISRIADGLKNKFETNHFQYLLEEKSIFCPGCHMVRTTSFLDVNPNRHIYPARRGQNWQLLLPLYYKYKRGYIDEPLYNYIIYSNSMSRGDDNFDKKIYRINEHLDILINTLSDIQMNDSDRNKYSTLITERYTRKKLYVAAEYGNILMLEEMYNILRKNNKLVSLDKIKYLEGKYFFFRYTIKVIKYPLRKLRGIL